MQIPSASDSTLGTELSDDFAFLAAYNDGENPADALLGYVNTINKELTRKRLEFGMDVIGD